MKILYTAILVISLAVCRGQDTSHLYPWVLRGKEIIGDSLDYYITKKPDTIKAVLLVTDTDTKSSIVYAVYGYYVTKYNFEQPVYLDERKRPLNKVIIWMAKENNSH